MARGRREMELSLDKRFFIKLKKKAKRKRRPYIGKDGKPIKIKKGGEK